MPDLRTIEAELAATIESLDPPAIEQRRKELLERNKALPSDDWSEEDLHEMVLLTSILRSKSRAGAPKAKAPSASKSKSPSKPLGDMLDAL